MEMKSPIVVLLSFDADNDERAVVAEQRGKKIPKKREEMEDSTDAISRP